MSEPAVSRHSWYKDRKQALTAGSLIAKANFVKKTAE
jgi:hypothetical protein